jgi:hypothetical protein
VHADAFTATYLWMRRGGRLHMLRGLEYEHRVHERSYAQVTAQDAKREIFELSRAIREERSWPAAANSIPGGSADGQEPA